MKGGSCCDYKALPLEFGYDYLILKFQLLIMRSFIYVYNIYLQELSFIVHFNLKMS